MTTLADGLPERVWFYSNYHCNLDCAYCLTESSPSSPRRELAAGQIARLARQAIDAGFSEFGVTGGEPFLRPDMVDIAGDLASLAPTVVLTNGTVFGPRRLDRVAELAGQDVALQISLDAPDADLNDELRAPENFAKVAETVPTLVEMGIEVRIATTVEPDRLDEEQHARLCALHRSWGVDDDHHIVRPIIRRGRAESDEMGITLEHQQIPAELTITADGAYWSPFGPTVRDGRMDTDLLLTRTIEPIEVPTRALAGIVSGLPAGYDAQIGIR